MKTYLFQHNITMDILTIIATSEKDARQRIESMGKNERDYSILGAQG